MIVLRIMPKIYMLHDITYSFIANCQTAVVHKSKTKRRAKIYTLSQYILRYNVVTVKLSNFVHHQVIEKKTNKQKRITKIQSVR